MPQCVAAWVGFRIMEETQAGAAGVGPEPEAPPASRATGSESREPTADPQAKADSASPLQVSAPGTAQGRTAKSRADSDACLGPSTQRHRAAGAALRRSGRMPPDLPF